MKSITSLCVLLALLVATLESCEKDSSSSNKKLSAAASCPRIKAMKSEESSELYKVTTFAGTNKQGYVDGVLCECRFSSLGSMAVADDGTIYVTDNGFFDQHVAVRKISPEGIVSTLAGGNSGYADGQGSAAQFTSLSGIVVGKDGNIYVGDRFRIRKITPQGEVSTFAGNGTMGNQDGPASQAQFNGVTTLGIGNDGTLYVPDQLRHVIRMVTPDGNVSVFAGKDTAWSTTDGGYRDGAKEEAFFSYPQSIKVMPDGTMYVAELANQRIRKISPDGQVSTVALVPSKTGVGSGMVVSADGGFYLSQGKRIRKVQPDGTVLEVAGENYSNPWDSNTPTYRDAVGLKARFFEVTDMVQRGKYLYMIDALNFCIRRMNVE